MLLPTSQIYTFDNFKLTSGAVLPKLDVAYETWGTLNDAGDNGILLCHGYTNHPHAGGDENGWFHNLLGPGKAVDTDKYFVVCSNMLGSSYGTTGPGSINPETGKPYGPDFPAYSTRDMVEVQKTLIDGLGVNQLKAVMGYSYGGHLTFMWGSLYPNRMRCLVPIAGVTERLHTAADIARIRARFESCPGWNDGHYYDNEPGGGVFEELIDARMETLGKYGQGTYLAAQGHDLDAAAAIIRERATVWAGQFDANSLWVLYQAGIGSNANVAAIIAPLLNVLARTDSVVDVALGQPTVNELVANGCDAKFLEIDTEYGHAGPMLDAHLWADDLKAFLDGAP